MHAGIGGNDTCDGRKETCSKLSECQYEDDGRGMNFGREELGAQGDTLDEVSIYNNRASQEDRFGCIPWRRVVR